MQCTGCGKAIPEFKAWVVSPPRDHYALFCSKACIAGFFAPDRTTLALPLPSPKPDLSPQPVVVDPNDYYRQQGESQAEYEIRLELIRRLLTGADR